MKAAGHVYGTPQMRWYESVRAQQRPSARERGYVASRVTLPRARHAVISRRAGRLREKRWFLPSEPSSRPHDRRADTYDAPPATPHRRLASSPQVCARRAGKGAALLQGRGEGEGARRDRPRAGALHGPRPRGAVMMMTTMMVTVTMTMVTMTMMMVLMMTTRRGTMRRGRRVAGRREATRAAPLAAPPPSQSHPPIPPPPHHCAPPPRVSAVAAGAPQGARAPPEARACHAEAHVRARLHTEHGRRR